MAHAAIDGSRLNADKAQMGHLVLHQGNKGSDNHTYAVHRQGRNLEGDALTASCRHQAKRVVTIGNAPDDFLLNAPEIFVAPISL